MRKVSSRIGMFFVLVSALLISTHASVHAESSTPGTFADAVTQSPVTLVEKGEVTCVWPEFTLSGPFRHNTDLTISKKGFVTGKGGGTGGFSGSIGEILIKTSSTVFVNVRGELKPNEQGPNPLLFLKSRKASNLKNKVVYKMTDMMTITCTYDGKTDVVECVPPMPGFHKTENRGLNPLEGWKFPELSLPLESGATKNWNFVEKECTVAGSSTIIIKKDN